MIIRTRQQDRLAFCFLCKMAFAAFVDVIIKVVLGPEMISDGIVVELAEIQQVQPFQQQ